MQQTSLLRFFPLALVLLAIFGTTAAQSGNPPKQIWSCGVTPDSGSGGPQPIIVGYDTTAIQHCGKFDLYFDDFYTNPNAGFYDPSLGAIRRNTFCAVVGYIESVIDLSNIPSATNPAD